MASNKSGNQRGLKAPVSKYPRGWLLQIYNQAIDEGMCLLRPFDEADVRTFTQSFYNLRRRAATGNQQFVTPEFRMVSIGQWRPDDGGTLPIYYNRFDLPLPAILPAGDADRAIRSLETPRPVLDPSVQALVEDEAELDINQFVKTLRDRANEHD